MQTKIKLKIGGVVILLRSSYPLIKIPARKNRLEYYRFRNFIYQGRELPNIVIDVRMVNRLPIVKGGRNTFITSHFQDKAENWRIIEKKGVLVFRCPVKGSESIALIKKQFSRVELYLLPKPENRMVWEIGDIADYFLHVLLINYLASRKLGFFAHAVGIRDSNGEGLLFCGKSGAGKSTTARIWFKHTQAGILNDDRVIVRKISGRFRLYSSPWHGEFYRNLEKRLRPALFKRLFFIYHGGKNTVARIDPSQAFRLLYPTIFPAFWNRRSLENTAGFCQELVQKVPCYQLGFVNDKKVIVFVRNIGRSIVNEKAAI
jgi:hypothetical protein